MRKTRSMHLPAVERRAVIVEAVLELSAERNPSDITTEAIATKMNLTQGALFRHFPSKHAVWQAVIKWVADELLARVDRAIEAAESPLSALEAVYTAHTAFVVVASARSNPRYTYKIGPTVPGRVLRVDVNVGDTVRAGQILGEMDPVDLDDRISAQDATISRADAAVRSAEAQVQDVSARKTYAEAQARRYEELSRAGLVSQELVEARRQERQVAEAGVGAALANLSAARQELAMARSTRDGLVRQRANLLLVAPVDGLVAARDSDPGNTVVAGQAVVEVIDPKSLWINARFDQLGSAELRPGQPVGSRCAHRPGMRSTDAYCVSSRWRMR